MKTINGEMYDVKNVHTKRLQNSPIIYMQKLLNEEKDMKIVED